VHTLPSADCPDGVSVKRMNKQVVRCSVCTRVHDLKELIDREQLSNGTSNFICPVRKTAGSYKLEQIGTIQTPDLVRI
jgi:hypothetical protein